MTLYTEPGKIRSWRSGRQMMHSPLISALSSATHNSEKMHYGDSAFMYYIIIYVHKST